MRTIQKRCTASGNGLYGTEGYSQCQNSSSRNMYLRQRTGAKGFNGLALCDMEDGDYDSALSNITMGSLPADGEDTAKPVV